MRRALIPTTVVTMCLALAATAAALTAAGGPAVAAKPHKVPHFGHVFLLIGENTNLSQLTAKSTPYLVGKLKPRGAWLTSYFAVANGSLADYIGMVAGHFKKCEVNDALPYHLATGKLFCHEPGNNLFHQLDGAHVSWTEWNESMPNPCAFFDTGVDWNKDVYSVHHNPAVYFDDIEGTLYNEAFHRRPNAECIHNVLATGTTAPNNTSAFDAALKTGHVARFNMVIPNDCENGHDHCGMSDKFGQFDAFLKREVPKIESSPAFGSNGLILITYDEWSTGSNHRVAFLALGPQVKPGVYSKGGPYSHYSLLRMLEDGFGLSTHLSHAATANPLDQIWK